MNILNSGPSKFQKCHMQVMHYLESELMRPDTQRVLSFYQLNTLYCIGKEAAEWERRNERIYRTQFAPNVEKGVIGLIALLPYVLYIESALVLTPLHSEAVHIARAFGIHHDLIEDSYVSQKKIIHSHKSLVNFLELGKETTFCDTYTDMYNLVVMNAEYLNKDYSKPHTDRTFKHISRFDAIIIYNSHEFPDETIDLLYKNCKTIINITIKEPLDKYGSYH